MQIAAKALYTLNLPGIPTFTLSFLSVNFTLKSAYVFVTVTSLAITFAKLSIPYVVILLSGNNFGIFEP